MLEGRLTANADVICRQEGDEALLFDPMTENVRVLNETGLALWLLCDGQHTKLDLVEYMAGEYPRVARETLVADVDLFLTALVDKNLLQTD